MSKSDSSTKTKPARSASRAIKPVKPARAPRGAARSGTKQEAVLALLKQRRGGWQPHSVRGFLTSVVRKKLGLPLTSDKRNGERVYQVTIGKPSKAKPRVEAVSEPAVPQ